jgi:hypothetical protein
VSEKISDGMQPFKNGQEETLQGMNIIYWQWVPEQTKRGIKIFKGLLFYICIHISWGSGGRLWGTQVVEKDGLSCLPENFGESTPIGLGILIYKLLQGLHISIRKTTGHWFDGFSLPIHQETLNILLSVLPPFFTTHGQDNIGQEGLQLRPGLFYLSWFHAIRIHENGSCCAEKFNVVM